MYDLIVVGGGAAGVFAAIQAKTCRPHARILLAEKTRVLLAKVRISGGGRCNVTHACFDPALLVANYPRGGKELRGLFCRFQPRDTIAWFAERGVPLKTEDDGRMFPITDRSETIISALTGEMARLGVEVLMQAPLQHILRQSDRFEVAIGERTLQTKALILATGSNRDGYALADSLGHTIVPPVPSLFTFNVPHFPLESCSGIALEDALLEIDGTHLTQRGELLITHFGFSGPAALKLSAWGARVLYECAYQVDLLINWLPALSQEQLLSTLHESKAGAPQKWLRTENPFHLPKNLWKRLLEVHTLAEKRLNDCSLKEIRSFASVLHQDRYRVEGKTTHKEEFVTCGGISLKEVDFSCMQSRRCPGLFFAGEILDIDGITGGFNFQAAWTTGAIAGRASIEL